MNGHQDIVQARLNGQRPKAHVIVRVCDYMEAFDNPTVVACSYADIDASWLFLAGLIVEVVFDEKTEWGLVKSICEAIKRVRPNDLWLRNLDNNFLFAVYWDRKNIDPDNPSLPTEVLFERMSWN